MQIYLVRVMDEENFKRMFLYEEFEVGFMAVIAKDETSAFWQVYTENPDYFVSSEVIDPTKERHMLHMNDMPSERSWMQYNRIMKRDN